MKRLVARGTVLLGLWCSQGTVAWGAVEELPTGAVTVEATPAESSAKMLVEHQPVLPQHRYLLEWLMKVEGEKRWRFLTEFAGIIVSFRDAGGELVGESRRSTSCWATAGWRSAWYQVAAPARAATMSVAFLIRSPQSLPGRFQIKDVRIREMEDAVPVGAGEGRLRILVRDEMGRATPARLAVQDLSGKRYAPPYAFTYQQGGLCFHEPSLALTTISLPPGKYEVSAMKGFEYGLARRQIDVQAGQTVVVELTLARRFHLGKLGWFSGDHHTHLFRHGGTFYPMMNLPDVYAVAKGEGLDFLPFMGLDRGEHGTDEAAEEGFIGRATEELTRDFWGHLCPVGVRGNPTLKTYGDAWPMNGDYLADTRAREGAAAYAHPYGPLRPDKVTNSLAQTKAGLIARGFPIDVALGHSCTLDVLTKEDAQGDFQLKLRDYMWLLNLGFRVGVSGSTDFHLDQGRREPIGGLRTYVRVTRLVWPEVAAAYNQGRTFTSNGPLLLFRAGGQEPGAIVPLGQRTELECAVDAYSLWGIQRVQIWRDGSVVKEIAAVDGQVRAVFSVPISRSGWLLAIAEGPAASEVMLRPESKPLVTGQFAMTSPIYVEAAQPAAPAPEAARYYQDWVNGVELGFRALLAEMAGEGKPVPPGETDAVLKRLMAAKRVFEAKASVATRPAASNSGAVAP